MFGVTGLLGTPSPGRVNKGFGLIIESVDAEYANIFLYSPLSGSTSIQLSCELKISMKTLINIKSKDNKFFLWCHIIHLNPLKTNSERITKSDKKMVNDLDYEVIEFPVSKADFSKTKKKKTVSVNVFCYENKLTYPVYLSDQEFKNCFDLFMISDENNSHFVYIKEIYTYV